MANVQKLESRATAAYRGMSLPDALQALLDPLDINVVAHPGWSRRRSSGRGMNPQAAITHWTAGSAKPGARTCQALCVRKALVTFYSPAASREIRVLANGRTGHAGKGNSAVLKQLQSGPPKYERHPYSNNWSGGYTSYTGIEVEHDGKSPVSQNSIDVFFGLGAALCLYFGWPAHRHISHQHHAGGRKIDFGLHENGRVLPYAKVGSSYAAGDFVNFAERTAEYMGRLGLAPVAAKPKPAAIDPDAKMPYVYLRDPMMFGEQVKHAQSMLNELGYDAGSADGWFGQRTQNAVFAMQQDWLGKGKVSVAAAGRLGQTSWTHLIKRHAEKTGVACS